MIKKLSISYIIISFFILSSLYAGSKEYRIFGALGLLKAMYDMRFDDDDELKTARKIEEVIAKKNIYYNESELANYIDSIVEKIKPFAIADRSTFSHYRIHVIRDYQLNAFTVGAGYIFVNSGIIAKLDNEAQLASVLAHEMAHVTKNHIQQTVHEHAKVSGVLSLATIGMGDKIAELSDKANLVLNLSLNAMVNGWGREKEEQADLTAVSYIIKAGYDPREMPKVFEILLETYGDPDPLGNFFYSNHPENRKRIIYVNKYISDNQSSIPFDDLKINQQSYDIQTKIVRFETGKDLIQDNQFNSGIKLLEKVSSTDTLYLDGYYWLGEGYRLQRKPEYRDKALSYYTDALRINENYAYSYLGIGMIFYEEKNYPLARTNFEKYLALNPNAPDREKIEKLIRYTYRYR
ncbi:MAG: M48 family metalloprotease [Candidatus Hydrogenedentota bacterium]